MKTEVIECGPQNGTKKKSRFSLRRSVTVAVLAASAIGLTGNAASATTTFPVDSVRVNDVHVDVGSGSLLQQSDNTYIPSGVGQVIWSQKLLGGVTATLAQLKARVYYDDKYQGGCASVRFTIYDIGGHRLATKYSNDFYPGAACRAGAGAPVYVDVNLLLGAQGAYRARVVPRVSYDNGVTWSEGDGHGTDYQDVFLGNG